MNLPPSYFSRLIYIGCETTPGTPVWPDGRAYTKHQYGPAPAEKPKPIALIDIDGVLCSLHDAANRRRFVEGLPPLSAPQTWDWTEATPEDREYVLKSCYGDPEFYKEAELLPGARDALRLLEGVYQLVIITGRAYYQKDTAQEKGFSEEIARITVDWLAACDLPEHLLLHCPMGDKGQFVRQYFADHEDAEIAFAVEDSPSAIKSYLAADIPVAIIDYPYNRQTYDAPGGRLMRRGTLLDVAWDMLAMAQVKRLTQQ